MVAFYGRSDDEMKKAFMLIPKTMGVPRLGDMFLVDYTSNGGQVELSLSRNKNTMYEPNPLFGGVRIYTWNKNSD
jgi:hypothetical protein